MVGNNAVLDKSKKFAVRIVRMYKFLCEKKEFVMSKQVLRSGTSIGANIREADVAMSKAEFIAKMNIALKEANETEYWLEILHETGYLSDSDFSSIYADSNELNRLLISIVKSSNR